MNGSSQAPNRLLADPAWCWAAYEPDAGRPWNLALAGHLYRRTAFGGTWKELQQSLADGPQRTIDKLLHPPIEAEGFNRTFDQYDTGATKADTGDALIAWWLRRMLETPWPLGEQMTLFWHNYFALTNAGANNAATLGRYLRLLRREALGHFDVLLQGMMAEPAFFVCLNARANRKAQPSLHLARVLLEQYTMGPGVCSERDMRETARAFAGWFVAQDQLQFLAHERDAGVKTVLGQEGDFDGPAIGRLLLRQPATSQWVVSRLYRWLISETETPPAALLAPLAASFSRDYAIAKVVGTMVRSNLFFSPVALNRKVKSPVEFALSLLRPLQGRVGTLRLGADLTALGQDLSEPPTTRGWAGHLYWLNSFTVIGRARLAQSLLASDGTYGGKLDPAALAAAEGHPGLEAPSQFFCTLLLQDTLPDSVRRKLAETAFGSLTPTGETPPDGLRQFIALLAALPEFQTA
jgi:uncharacterized protein (DUF1800 family)